MIKSDKGMCKIDGSGSDVIFEFNHIIEMLIADNPHILLGVLTGWSEIIEKTSNKVDVELMTLVDIMSERYIKLKSEGKLDE